MDNTQNRVQEAAKAIRAIARLTQQERMQVAHALVQEYNGRVQLAYQSITLATEHVEKIKAGF